MKLGLRLDRTHRTVAEAKLEPGRTGLGLAPGRLRRILLWATPFPLLAALTLYLGSPPLMAALPLAFGAYIVLWQVFAYGSSDGKITPEQLSATRLYPRGVLIFLAFFWAALITAVSVALWLKARRGA